MNLTPAQAKIAVDTHRFRVLVCGRKFGKTTLASEEQKGCAISGDNKRILYIAPTLDDARRLMWERLKRALQGALSYVNEARLELKIQTQMGGVSDLFLGSWEKVQNYRGDEFDFVVLDEVQDYRDFWVGWSEALRPTLTPRKGQALFMGTPKGFNHLYDLYGFSAKDPDYIGYKFTSYDNPNLPPEEIEKAKLELTEDRFAQEYLAEFRKTEGLVYKEFKREIDIYDTEEEPEFRSVIVGCDFGYTNPTALLRIGIDGDGTYWIAEEWYKTGQTTEQIIEKTFMWKPSAVYPDPAEPDRIEQMKKAGLNAREVSKDIVGGVDRVRELFKQRKIKIHRSCLNLIYELETYAYPESRDSRKIEEKPLKLNDHALDALRYSLYSHRPGNFSPFQKFDKMKYI